MDKIKKFMNSAYKRHYVNFKKYTIIGVTFSLLEIFFLWVFIDIMKKPTLVYAIVIVGILTVLKFYSYVLSGMMKHNFFGYIFVLIIFYIFNVLLIWLLVSIGFSAAFSSAFLSITFFILRFLTYDELKLLKN